MILIRPFVSHGYIVNAGANLGSSDIGDSDSVWN